MQMSALAYKDANQWVETRGLEPLTLWMQTRCSPN